jgi:adenylyltransferase/sulfurtransferase
VRESYEFEDYNIGGINIPLYELKDNIPSLPENKKLVFCCQTGQRSKMAIQLLKPFYKGEMYSLKNGIV